MNFLRKAFGLMNHSIILSDLFLPCLLLMSIHIFSHEIDESQSNSLKTLNNESDPIKQQPINPIVPKKQGSWIPNLCFWRSKKYFSINKEGKSPFREIFDQGQYKQCFDIINTLNTRDYLDFRESITSEFSYIQSCNIENENFQLLRALVEKKSPMIKSLNAAVSVDFLLQKNKFYLKEKLEKITARLPVCLLSENKTGGKVKSCVDIPLIKGIDLRIQENRCFKEDVLNALCTIPFDVTEVGLLSYIKSPDKVTQLIEQGNNNEFMDFLRKLSRSSKYFKAQHYEIITELLNKCYNIMSQKHFLNISQETTSFFMLTRRTFDDVLFSQKDDIIKKSSEQYFEEAASNYIKDVEKQMNDLITEETNLSQSVEHIIDMHKQAQLAVKEKMNKIENFNCQDNKKTYLLPDIALFKNNTYSVGLKK